MGFNTEKLLYEVEFSFLGTGMCLKNLCGEFSLSNSSPFTLTACYFVDLVAQICLMLSSLK